MSDLKSALLNVLPVQERTPTQYAERSTCGVPMFQTNTVDIKPQDNTSGDGLEGLKAVLRKRKAITFKYNSRDDRLYVYFATKSAAMATYVHLADRPQIIGSLPIRQTSVTGFRVDNASQFKYDRPVSITVKPEVPSFATFTESVKSACQELIVSGVTLSFKINVEYERVFVYVTSNRKIARELRQPLANISKTVPYMPIVVGEYSTTLRFDYPRHKKTAPLFDCAADKAPATSLMSAMQKTAVEADPASKLVGLVPQETLDQVRRILAGERLPKPIPKPRFVTQGGMELKLFTNSNKEYDLVATIAELNRTARNVYVFTEGQLSSVDFGSIKITLPTIILMRDVSNSKAAFVVIRSALGYHNHVRITQV